ncbi:MAG: hypothetical protein ACM3TN_12245 [Alphaproteobacteria bacterium]
MDKNSRAGRRRLLLLGRFPCRLYPIAVVAILVLQSCGTPTLTRWRRSEQPRPVEQAPAASRTEPAAPPVAKPDFEAPPEIAHQPLKPAPFPESVLAVPAIDSASAQLKYDTVVFGRKSDASSPSGWQYRVNRNNQIVGFEFSNRGGNRILPNRYDIAKNLLFTRDFQFRFDDRARQDIHLAVTDWAPSADRQFRLSELMNTIMHFFPRNYLPAITSLDGRYIVTLPTGEQIQFDALTREIVGGVFSEAPVDLTPNRAARKFPAVSYSGKGVVIRVNARGADPRLGTTATITTGSPADCPKGKKCDQCQVPSRELWSQSGAVRFKFPRDAEFDQYLRSRCGFGLPVIEPDYVMASTAK